MIHCVCHTAQQGGPPQASQPGVAVVQQRTIVSKPLQGGPTQVMRTTVVAASKPVGPSGPMQQPMGSSPIGGKTCSKCHVNPANRGRGWCEQCFRQSNP